MRWYLAQRRKDDGGEKCHTPTHIEYIERSCNNEGHESNLIRLSNIRYDQIWLDIIRHDPVWSNKQTFDPPLLGFIWRTQRLHWALPLRRPCHTGICQTPWKIPHHFETCSTNYIHGSTLERQQQIQEYFTFVFSVWILFECFCW